MITIVDQNLDEWHPSLCDFSLPSCYAANGPYVMVNGQISPNRSKDITAVLANETLRETFLREKKGTITARIEPTEEFPKPDDIGITCLDRGWNYEGRLIVPDYLRWGELTDWCGKQGDMCQTNLFPIAAASRATILDYLSKHRK